MTTGNRHDGEMRGEIARSGGAEQGDATLARAQLGEFLKADPAPFARGIADSAAR